MFVNNKQLVVDTAYAILDAKRSCKMAANATVTMETVLGLYGQRQ
jgi:hypothetical protein